MISGGNCSLDGGIVKGGKNFILKPLRTARAGSEASVFSADRAPVHNGNLHASYGRQAAASAIHSVQFYGDDRLFLDSLSEFVGATLGAGGACLLIATQSHRAGLAERLKAHGIDVAYAIAMNRLPAMPAKPWPRWRRNHV
jgi:MEDS: MEthanogen/methylotroph, DcmR Sensory domain